jgi:hypothetical protein
MKQLWTLMILLLGMGITVSPLVRAADTIDPKSMLAQAEALSRELREGAGTMQVYVRWPEGYDNESHERKLLVMRENANKLGEILQKLHQNRTQLEDWQGELVTRLMPRMNMLADDLENAIKFIEDNPKWVYKPVYGDYVDGAYNQADAMANSIDRWFDWADSAEEIREARQ